MRKRLALGGAALTCAALALLATPAAAHHSFAAFDTTRIVRIDGVVAEFQWTNPHAWLEVDAKNPQGGVDRWGIEFNSPNNLTREGWSRHMLNAGDRVSVLLNPMRDGEHGGLYYAVTFANGQTKTVQMTPFAKPVGFDASKAPSAYDSSTASPPTQEKQP